MNKLFLKFAELKSYTVNEPASENQYIIVFHAKEITKIFSVHGVLKPSTFKHAKNTSVWEINVLLCVILKWEE